MKKSIKDVCEQLKLSRAEKREILALTSTAARQLRSAQTPVEIRQAASKIEKQYLKTVINMLRVHFELLQEKNLNHEDEATTSLSKAGT